MSNINSISGGGFSMMMSGTKRPDPSQMVDDLFSKLDTTGKGYLTKSDLQSALTQLPGADSSNSTGSTSSSANVGELFKKLDANGDGKITKDELSSGLKQLADAFGSKNVTGGGKSGAPAASGTPPSGSSTSSIQSSSTSKTYDPADTNQDGTVSASERIAYALKQLESQLDLSASSTSNNSASSTSKSSDAKIFKQITDIMQAYGSSDSGSNNSNLSVTA